MAWGSLALADMGLVFFQPAYGSFALFTLLFAALPEEWFFRAYLMTRLGTGPWANLMASLLFSLVHGLTRGWTTAFLVFVPSLIYGWLYQRSRDLPLLVLVHALSNLIYAMFLAKYIAAFLGDLR